MNSALTSSGIFLQYFSFPYLILKQIKIRVHRSSRENNIAQRNHLVNHGTLQKCWEFG